MWVGLIQSVEGLDRTTPEQEEILLADSFRLTLQHRLFSCPPTCRPILQIVNLQVSIILGDNMPQNKSLSLSMYVYIHIPHPSY